MKKMDQEQRLLMELGDYCQRGDVEHVATILEKSPYMDITHRDGEIFGLATVAKTGSPEVLELLINYYKKTRMQSDPLTSEYKDAKERLLDILESEGNWSNVPPAIKAAIDKHLDTGEDTDMEFDPADYGADDLPSDHETEESAMASAHDSDHYLPLTVENLRSLDSIRSISTDDESTGYKIAASIKADTEEPFVAAAFNIPSGLELHSHPAPYPVSAHFDSTPYMQTAADNALPPIMEAAILGANSQAE